MSDEKERNVSVEIHGHFFFLLCVREKLSVADSVDTKVCKRSCQWQVLCIP